MAEPKVRFKRDDGSSYPAWNTTKMSTLTNEYKVRNKTKLPLEIYSVNNEVGFLPQSEQFEDAGYLNDTDTSIYMIVPPNHFAYNPARINIGSIGYQNVGHDVQVSSLYEVFRTTENIDDCFLWYWFHTPIFNKAVLSLQEGGVRLYFYYEKLKETSIFVPCLEEQQKIADFLYSVDEVITASEEEVANLETQKKAVMKKIFSQEVRFKRADGSAFPEWAGSYRLADVSDFITKGATPTTYGFDWVEKGIPFFRNDAIRDNTFVYGDFSYISEEAHSALGRSEIKAGDLLIAITGEIGKVGMVPKEIEKGNINQHTARVRIISEYIPYFVYQYLCSDSIQNVYKKIKTGLSMAQLSLEQIRNTEIPIVDIEEQSLIAEFLSDFDVAITAAKKELELWKELKKGLLQLMFV